MAETIEDLKKQLDEMKKKIDDNKKSVTDLADSGGKLKSLSDSFVDVKNSVIKSNAAAGEFYETLLKTNNIKMDGLSGVFSNLSKAILGSSNNTSAYASIVTNLGDAFNKVLPGVGTLLKVVGADIPAAFDAFSGTTRQFKKDTIDLGSAYGLSFEQIARKTIDYQNAVLFANKYTFEGIDAIRAMAAAAANAGLSIDELTNTFSVAGHQQSILSEGFLLSSATGLKSSDVFKKLAEASRFMGYSVENANRPIVALENIARSTGLPITQFSDRIFETAKQASRLGLTVDGMTPLIKRFADTLGPAFKGLAIEEVTNLMKGLESKINTTESAFIAMRGGLAGPGTSAIGAQLAFEDAFKDPKEIMKSLANTLSGVTGGRIIKFEEARANPALEGQFKLQRELLGQLTGNRDPQSQRTLMAMLDSLQSGKALNNQQEKTLEDLLGDGQRKQAEAASVQDQLNRITVGLQTQTNVILGNMLNRMLPSQVIGELARKGQGAAETGAEAVLENAKKLGNYITDMAKKSGIDIGEMKEGATAAINSQLPEPGLNDVGRSNLIKESPFTEPVLERFSNIPGINKQNAGLAAFTPTQQVSPQGTAGARTETGQAQEIIITLRSTDDLAKLIADGAAIRIRKTNHGQ